MYLKYNFKYLPITGRVFFCFHKLLKGEMFFETLAFEIDQKTVTYV
jgi:hypothetical protein